MNEKKLNIKPNELTTPSSDEAEQEKIINLWEETKPFGELKESLRRHISKRLDIQVKKTGVLFFVLVYYGQLFCIMYICGIVYNIYIFLNACNMC